MRCSMLLRPFCLYVMQCVHVLHTAYCCLHYSASKPVGTVPVSIIIVMSNNNNNAQYRVTLSGVVLQNVNGTKAYYNRLYTPTTHKVIAVE